MAVLVINIASELGEMFRPVVGDFAWTECHDQRGSRGYRYPTGLLALNNTCLFTSQRTRQVHR